MTTPSNTEHPGGKGRHACRVCGALYQGCDSCSKQGAFMWRQVACSADCAQEYFRKTLEARSRSAEEH